MMRNTFAALSILSMLCGGAGAFAVAAEPPSVVALVSAGHGLLEWTPLVESEGITLALADPQGLVRTFQFGPGEAPALSLSDAQGSPLPDGIYTWELRLTPYLSIDLKQEIEDAQRRGDAEELPRLSRLAAPLVQSGHFRIADGSLVAPDLAELPERGPRKAASPESGVTAAPDQMVPDDLIIDGKGCIGLGCANNEPFGAEALRLKQSVVRLRFQDTSTGASFPSGDWQLTVNDSASGGADRFSLEDLTATTTPLTIRGGAPSNSLYVDGVGNIGLGTATPARDLHLASGSAPTLRFEQTSATPRTWDVAADASSFSVKDVTNASAVPFRIAAGAPTNSIEVTANGNVGIGTSSPGRSFEVARAGAVEVALLNSSSTHAGGGTASPTRWFLQTDNDPTRTFKISKEGTGGAEVTISDRLDVNGATLTVDGSVQATNLTAAANIVTGSGNVGVGTSSPGAPLHVSRSTGAILEGIRLSNNNEARISIQNTGLAAAPKYYMAVNSVGDGLFFISREGGGGTILEVTKRLDGGLGSVPSLKVNGSIQAVNVVFTSSRALKEDIRPLDPQEVLDRIAGLPISEWKFKEGPQEVRHIGPMAEDFQAAFGLSPDQQTISVTDASGVALAAIQGLYAELQEQKKMVEELRKQIEQLKAGRP